METYINSVLSQNNTFKLSEHDDGSRLFFNSFLNIPSGADFCSRAYKTTSLDPKRNTLDFIHVIL